MPAEKPLNTPSRASGPGGPHAFARWLAGRSPHTVSRRVLLALVGDILCCSLSLALLGMYYLGDPWVLLHGHRKAVLAWATIIPVCMYYFDGYSSVRFANRLSMMMSVIKAGIVGSLLFASAAYFFSADYMSRRSSLLIIGYSMAVLLVWRLLLSETLRHVLPRRRVAIIGAGWAGKTIAEELQARPGEYEIVGFFDDNPDVGIPGHIDASVIGPVSEAPSRMRRTDTDMCVMAITRSAGANVHRALQSIYRAGVPILPMTDLYEMVTGKVALDHWADNWFVNIGYGGGDPLLLTAKRALDIAVSAAAITVTSPLWVLIAAAIRLTSPGPAFYRQERVGLKGRVFTILKFRSMRQDAESANGATWAARNDPRVTPLGGCLRRTRLDELPQLINILVGDMSLVGPRPERPEFVERFEREIPFYGMRVSVRPGLTGWAQVLHKYDETLKDVQEKLQYDLFHVKHWSPFLDLRILVKTVAIVLTGKGAH